MKKSHPTLLSDEEIFQDLFNAIQKKKAAYFKAEKKRIENTIKLTIGAIGQEEQLQFLEQERAKLNKQVFEGPDATHIIEKLNYKTFIEKELSHPARIKYARELVNDPKDMEMFVSSLAGRYLPPHMFAYLIQKITAIKQDPGKKLSNAGNGFGNPVASIVKTNKQKKAVKEGEKTDFFIKPAEKISDQEKIDKQINFIQNLLYKEGFIGKIPLPIFKRHFKGYTHIKLINWLGNQYDLIYLIKALKPFMNSELYHERNPSITTLSKHFLFNGSPVNINSLRVKASQQVNEVSKRFSDTVALIINGLNAF